MKYQSEHPLFRSLNDAEVKEFEEWARTHDPDPPNINWSICHPVVRQVWAERGLKPVTPSTDFAFCTHNTMVRKELTTPATWMCAQCAYIYGRETTTP